MKKINRKIVSAVIISKDNKILMGKKDPKGKGVYLDCWHIPGGGMEKDETQLDTLKREVQEEVGINITSCKIEHVNEDKATAKGMTETKEEVLYEMAIFIYKVILDNNSQNIKVELHDDLISYEWIDFKNLSTIKLPPPSIRLFQKLGYLVL